MVFFNNFTNVLCFFFTDYFATTKKMKLATETLSKVKDDAFTNVDADVELICCVPSKPTKRSLPVQSETDVKRRVLRARAVRRSKRVSSSTKA